MRLDGPVVAATALAFRPSRFDTSELLSSSRREEGGGEGSVVVVGSFGGVPPSDLGCFSSTTSDGEFSTTMCGEAFAPSASATTTSGDARTSVEPPSESPAAGSRLRPRWRSAVGGATPPSNEEVRW